MHGRCGQGRPGALPLSRSGSQPVRENLCPYSLGEGVATASSSVSPAVLRAHLTGELPAQFGKMGRLAGRRHGRIGQARIGSAGGADTLTTRKP